MSTLTGVASPALHDGAVELIAVQRLSLARGVGDAYRATFVRSLAMVPIRRVQPIGAIGNYWATHHRVSEQESRPGHGSTFTLALPPGGPA